MTAPLARRRLVALALPLLATACVTVGSDIADCRMQEPAHVCVNQESLRIIRGHGGSNLEAGRTLALGRGRFQVVTPSGAWLSTPTSAEHQLVLVHESGEANAAFKVRFLDADDLASEARAGFAEGRASEEIKPFRLPGTSLPSGDYAAFRACFDPLPDRPACAISGVARGDGATIVFRSTASAAFSEETLRLLGSLRAGD